MVVVSARTADGRYRVWLHADHTAQLVDAVRGVVLTARVALYSIGAELDARGYDSADLTPE